MQALKTVKGACIMKDKRLDEIKNGDKTAFEALLCDYEPLILSECSALLGKFPEYREDREEMVQEGRLALYSAALKYEQSDKVTFGLYAKICIRNRLISYIRKLGAEKRRRDRIAEKTEKSASSSAEELAISFENSRALKELLDTEASEYEKAVFSLYLQKKSYSEIASRLKRSEKSVANAICRVKAKLKKRLL